MGPGTGVLVSACTETSSSGCHAPWRMSLSLEEMPAQGSSAPSPVPLRTPRGPSKGACAGLGVSWQPASCLGFLLPAPARSGSGLCVCVSQAVLEQACLRPGGVTGLRNPSYKPLRPQ